MTDPKQKLTAEDVVAAGLDDWRELYGALHTRLNTGDFQSGLDLVTAIGAAAEAAGHHPDVTLTFPLVEVKLTSHDVGGVTSRDIDLARVISEIASKHGVTADPTVVSRIELALDTPDYANVAPFWAAVLGFESDGDEIRDPSGIVPSLWFQKREEDDGTGQRFHVDVDVPYDKAQERIDAAVAAGGKVVDDKRAPAFVVVQDPDGNNACICTGLARQG